MSVRAANLQQKYVGQSGCAAEFKSAINREGIRLDKSQRADLETYAFKSVTILLIVQHASDRDLCGVIRDVVSFLQPNYLVWECVDPKHPSAVVIGTWPAKHRGVSGPAIESWEVDLSKLRFIQLHTHVTCRSRSYAGADDGGDLATWAKKRGARQPQK
jgi:hypothetical protein